MEENRAASREEIREAEASAPETEAALDLDEWMRRLQPELERWIARALEAAREEWMQEARRQMRQEAGALAQMSGEERAEYDLAQREAQLEARERDVLRRELRADAVRWVEERGLPLEMADVLDYASPERAQASLDAAERAFRAAVQRGVEMRMRGGAPAAGRRDAGAPESDDDYYRARYAQGGTARQGG